jgi:hypothetical protein
MVVLFCLRLALGLMACLLLLSPKQVNPRFYRTHFLTAVGLGAGALVLSWSMATPRLQILLSAAIVAALFGSIVWSLEDAPGGIVAILAATVMLAGTLAYFEHAEGAAVSSTGGPPPAFGWRLAGDFTSAGLLGAATTAMLMGHSYLIAPAMSLTPLMRLLAALAVTTVLRMAIGAMGLGLWSHTTGGGLTLGDVSVWLPVRWLLGFIGPLVLGWMAWRAARIRSTQSATGILYVVVIFSFLGELTGQLLLATTGFVL